MFTRNVFDIVINVFKGEAGYHMINKYQAFFKNVWIIKWTTISHQE